jgi:hypothetical protein
MFAAYPCLKCSPGVPKLRKIQWLLSTSLWKGLQACCYRLYGQLCRLIRRLKLSRRLLPTRKLGCRLLSSSMEVSTMHRTFPNGQINQPFLTLIRTALKLRTNVLRLDQQYIDSQLIMEERRLILTEVLVSQMSSSRSLLFAHITSREYCRGPLHSYRKSGNCVCESSPTTA